MPTRYKHIVVVHGIGDQAPNETVLGFLNELIRVLPSSNGYTVDVHNLIEGVEETRLRPAYLTFTTPSDKHVIGFSEVYWQTITNDALKLNDGQPPIPITTWAHSINTRLLGPGHDLAAWRDVIANVESLLRIVRKLAAISKKSETFVKITTRFLGDVQMYAESDHIREKINNRFLSVLSRIHSFSEETREQLDLAGFDSFEIYVVSHSEGTVVSLNSLVQAAMLVEGPLQHPHPDDEGWFAAAFEDEKKRIGAGGEPAQVWLARIAGLVTFGSPIDKHHTIWRNRFRKNFLKVDRPAKIPWFNYWDRSDPVGYGLNEIFVDHSLPTTDARRVFDWPSDNGFTRYPIPGLAHVEYWT
ncbi:MAG: hypothetical protein ACRD96_07380, partial [Bryobacteraceae bacterium]